MKFILILILLLSGLEGVAQVFVGETNINEQKDMTVCEILVNSKPLSEYVEVMVDFGQDRKQKNDASIVEKESGKPIKFKSNVDVINHMERNGWIYLNSLVITGGAGYRFVYYFRKKTNQ